MKHSSRITPGGDPDNDGKTTAAAAPEDGGEFAIDPLRMHHLVRNLYSSSLMLGQGFNREGCFVIDTGSVDFLNFFKKNAVNTGETHPQLSQNPTLYEMPLKEAVKVAYREPLTWGHQDSSVARGRQESSVGSIATAVSLNSNPEKVTLTRTLALNPSPIP
uniref:Uncharacterized protein n=1 Tax=Phaeomonas parva TaxID=124430 RepID=A0A7S1UCZ0_9STRA|mmetsp:Transcript_42371/g.132845  ORF Transcript_42371/g.132845 Transcript_42371/m.132845 type:complete len:161 (+) Transcript_42371:494-976(+)